MWRFVVDRMACVNLPEFPLQLLLRQHPDWRRFPVVVVDRDKAQGVILWTNERARRFRILPGMRYAAGLSLSNDLRAGVVSDSQTRTAVDELIAVLRFYTSDIEPSEHEPGVFWLDASGLSLLYPSLQKWADMIRSDLIQRRFQCTVTVGFSRFGTYAIAKTRHNTATPSQTIVFETHGEERREAGRVPIERLGFDPKLRDLLIKLGIKTLGDFLRLPSNGIRKRFGREVHRLYQLARGELWSPLQPTPHREPTAACVDYDHPEVNLQRLVWVIQKELDALMNLLTQNNEALTAITIHMTFDNKEKRSERLQTAAPTTDLPQVIDLVRLRLESVTLSAGVTAITLEVDSVPVTTSQGDLFAEKPARDLAATHRAFARLRAEFGEGAVVSARLRDGHLPEARFEWAPIQTMAAPQPRNVRFPPLVRRIFMKPTLVSHGRPRRPDEQLGSFINDGIISEPLGPYIVSGGWWIKEVQREYYFVRTRQGRSLWIYYDRRRKRWFLHGAVE